MGEKIHHSALAPPDCEHGRCGKTHDCNKIMRSYVYYPLFLLCCWLYV